MGHAQFTGMLLFVGALLTLAVVGLVLIFHNLRRAPEGYEDNKGFHILRNRAHGSRIFSTKNQGSQPTPVPSLKQIKA